MTVANHYYTIYRAYDGVKHIGWYGIVYRHCAGYDESVRESATYDIDAYGHLDDVMKEWVKELNH